MHVVRDQLIQYLLLRKTKNARQIAACDVRDGVVLQVVERSRPRPADPRCQHWIGRRKACPEHAEVRTLLPLNRQQKTKVLQRFMLRMSRSRPTNAA